MWLGGHANKSIICIRTYIVTLLANEILLICTCWFKQTPIHWWTTMAQVYIYVPCLMLLVSVPGNGVAFDAVAHSSSTLQVNFSLVGTSSLSTFEPFGIRGGYSWSLGRYCNRKHTSQQHHQDVVRKCYKMDSLYYSIVKYISLNS